jgi:propionate CoA-transferase
MDFNPIIDRPPRLMDARIFRPEPMNLKEALLRVPLTERLIYDAQENLFFVNFEGYAVKHHEDIEAIRTQVEARLAPLGHKVFAIVNYDNFTISSDLIDDYMDMVQKIVERFYTGVTRYTTSAFLRMKLGDALKERNVAPHIYESEDEARQHLQESQ